MFKSAIFPTDLSRSFLSSPQSLSLRTSLIAIVILAFAWGLASPPPAEGQVWKRAKERIKEKVEEVRSGDDVTEAIRCVLDDDDCIRKAQESGRDVKVTDRNGRVVERRSGNQPQAVEAGETGVPDNAFAGTTTTNRYGRVDERQPRGQSPRIRISNDGAHVAISGLEGSRQVVRVNGVSNSAYDEVFFDTFVFSSSGGRYAYFARKGNDCIVVVDGKEAAPAPCDMQAKKSASRELVSPFQFSKDGNRFVYVKPLYKTVTTGSRHGGMGSGTFESHVGSVVVIDGNEGPPIGDKNVDVYVRGSNVFYVGRLTMDNGDAEAVSLFVNNEPEPAYMSIPKLVISDDGGHYAYIGENHELIPGAADKGGARKQVQQLVVDGVPGPKYDDINLFMHRKAGTVYYFASKAHTVEHVIEHEGRSRNIGRSVLSREFGFGKKAIPIPHDLTVSPPRGYITQNRVVRTDDLFAIQEYSSGSERMIQPTYWIALSADGSRVGFIGTEPLQGREKRTRAWIDGEPGPDYDKILQMKFTGDSQNFIYLAMTGGKTFVVTEDKEFGPYAKAGKLTVSKTSGSFAYQAQSTSGSAMRWYVNGEPTGPNEARQELGDLTFSPDGSRYAFSGQDRQLGHFLVVDGAIREEQLEENTAPTNFGLQPTSQSTGYSSPTVFFSPRKNRLVYVATQRTEQHYQGLTGVKLENDFLASPVERTKSRFNYITLSPSEDRVAYLRSFQRRSKTPLWVLYVDGRPGPVVGNGIAPLSTAVRFLDDNTVEALGMFDGGEIVRTTVKL